MTVNTLIVLTVVGNLIIALGIIIGNMIFNRQTHKDINNNIIMCLKPINKKMDEVIESLHEYEYLESRIYELEQRIDEITKRV